MPFTIGPGEILMVLFIAALYAVPVFLVYALFRFAQGRRQDPRRILDQRLAKGEISIAEREAALQALGR